MFFYYQGGETSVPALTHKGFYLNLNGPYQWVSIGWQNEGYATNLYASQMFIMTNGTSGYIELVNTSTTSTGVWMTGVYVATDSAAADAAPAEITISQAGEGSSGGE